MKKYISRVAASAIAAILYSGSIFTNVTPIMASQSTSTGVLDIKQGTNEIKLDSADITKNWADINAIQSQLSGLDGGSISYDGTYFWYTTSDGSKVKMGAVGTVPSKYVLEGYTYSSDDGVELNGTMPLRKSSDILLTSANKTQTLPAGYYPTDFNVSTDIAAIDGTITYYHHLHSTTSTTATYTDHVANSVSGPSDNSTNPSSYNNFAPCGTSYCSGCYTQPVYHTHTSACYYTWSERVHDCDCHRDYGGDDTDGIYGNEYTVVCTCGDWYDRWHSDLRCPVSGGSNAIVAYKIPSTILRSGTIVKAVIDYNN